MPALTRPHPFRGLLSGFLAHLSAALDALCFFVAFWLVDRCTFGRQEPAPPATALPSEGGPEAWHKGTTANGRHSPAHSEGRCASLGEKSTRGEWQDGHSDDEGAHAHPQRTASESRLLFQGAGAPTHDADCKNPRRRRPWSFSASVLREGSGTGADAGAGSSPGATSSGELHHFQKQLFKRQMARSLAVAAWLRRLSLAAVVLGLVAGVAWLVRGRLPVGILAG